MDAFIVRADNSENILDLTDEQAGKLFKALFLHMEGKEPDIDDQSVRIIYRTMRGQVDRSNEKYEELRKKRSEAGKKGMKSRWTDNKVITNDNTVITNDNKPLQRDNKNNLPNPNPNPNPKPINKKDILSGKKPDYPYKEVIEYLNQKTGKAFRWGTKETQRLIKARFDAGFTLDDFKRVIDTKALAWGNDPKMDEYLRPQTLFGTKFESYLNEKPTVKTSNRFNNFQGRTYDYKSLEAQLLEV